MNFILYEMLPLILNMSLIGSTIIAVVLCCRFLMKKAPKVFSYILWSVVLFRLLCPFAIQTNFSLIGIFETPTTVTGMIEYIPQDIVHTENPKVQIPLPMVNDIINESLPQGEEQLVADPLEAPVALATSGWLTGIAAMLIFAIIQLIKLKRKLVGATPLRDNIYIADHISSPFVMGFIKPKIYLPSSMAESEQNFIIAHEQYHVKRFDHITRILAFIALTIHWFNPLVWLAFVLSGKDMEMSCDEAVIKKIDTDIRAEYSQSLLRFATGRKYITATPLAFGEGDTKDRVKNVMKYKKPMIGIVITLIVLVAGLIVVLGTNAERTVSDPENSNASKNQGISDFKGVELYVWKNEIDETYFTLLSGTNRNKTEEEIYDKSIATTDMGKIANTLLGFDDGLSLFIIQMNETDFAKDEMLAYEQEIIAYIGESVKNYTISIGVFNSSNRMNVPAEDTPVGENSDNLKEAVDISKHYIENNEENKILNYEQPKVEKIHFTESYKVFNTNKEELVDIQGKTTYKVTYETEDDPILGPITLYIDVATMEAIGFDARK